MKTKLFAVALTLATAAGASPKPAVYAFESDANGFNTRNYFYDTGREVVAFDTQFTPELAKQSIAFLKTKTNHPITYVVITHPNPDKFNGLAEFQKEGAQVIASRSTADAMAGTHAYKKYFFVQIAKMFTEATYPKLGTPDRLFEGTETLKLAGGHNVELRELARPGISSTQTVAYLPDVEGLVVGDLVHNKSHAWLEGGIVAGAAKPEIQGWIADLQELAQRYPATARVLGGRGAEMSLTDSVAFQVDYLRRAEKLVESYLAKLGARKDELKTAQAGTHYAALKVEFEKEFPGLGLSYLIEYGVYGLVNSKL